MIILKNVIIVNVNVYGNVNDSENVSSVNSQSFNESNWKKTMEERIKKLEEDSKKQLQLIKMLMQVPLCG